MEDKEKRLTSMKAAIECLRAAIKADKEDNYARVEIALDNAQASVKSAYKW